MDDVFRPAPFLALAGFIGGLVLFARGLIAYRHDRLISSVATSSLDGLAAGEVRVSGVVEANERALVSPLQSTPCVWYRARVEETGDNGRVLLDEERAQEFRIRDATGEIRVVPRGARWEIGIVFDESTSITGAEPIGLARRTGASFTSTLERDPEQMSEFERQAAIRTLLTVQQPAAASLDDDWSGGIGGFRGLGLSGFGSVAGANVATRRKRYREARLEPGETVTIVGQAVPWADVRDLLIQGDAGSNVETAISADIARAREMGLLAASPEEAWGNAAIPGFGIGRPTQRPELDPRAHQPEPLGPKAHEAAMARYDIPDEELVLSRGERGVMAVYKGTPQVAATHHDFAFVLGVLGAIVTVVSAFAIGAVLTGTL